MFQLDEKVIKDSRTLITINGEKSDVDPITKNGTIHYTDTGKNLWLTTPKVRTAYTNKQDYTKVLDKIVLARNGVNIDGSYEFDDPITFNDNVEIKKDLLVRGNFTVEGDSSIIDTPRLTIEDNIIELNRNERGAGITLKKSGTAINRGSSDFVRYLFDEDSKSFILDHNDNMDADVENSKWVMKGHIQDIGDHIAGELEARVRLSAPNGKFSETLTVGGITTLTRLNVLDRTTLSGELFANGVNTFNGKIVSNNSVLFNKPFTAKDLSTFDGPVVTNGFLTANNNSTFNAVASFNRGIEVSEFATINAPTTISETLSVDGDTTLSRDLTVNGFATINKLKVTTKTETATLSVTSDANITGNTLVNGTLTANGLTTLNGGSTIKRNLAVTGTSTFTGETTMSGGNLTLVSSSDVNGNAFIGGSTSISKTLTVNGDADFKSNVSIGGSLSMASGTITANNIVSKTNVSVTSTDGYGYRFGNSDNYKIYMKNSTEGVLDSTSDKNMYFKVSDGTNRGFVFKNGNTPLFQIEGSGQVRVKDKIISKGYDVLTRENEGHKSDATGINVDKLDGLHASSFLRSDANSTLGANKILHLGGNNAQLTADASGNVLLTAKTNITIGADSDLTNPGVEYVNIKATGTDGLKVYSNNITYLGNKVWHAGNDGSNSGCDADLLDGHHASYFAAATHLHDDRYTKKSEVDLNNKYQIKYNSDLDSLDFIYQG